MFPLPALPLPRIFKGLEVENAKAFCMVFGPALLIQWLLPWSGHGGWSWSSGMMGMTLWSLIAGIGLTVLAFAPIPNLKSGHIFAAAAGAGLVGILWSTASVAGPFVPFFFTTLFGLLGVAVMTTALFLWSRNGFKSLYLNLLWGAVVSLGLGLLIPMNGEIPLIAIFKVLGADGINIMARIFYMLLSLGYVALLVLVVMNILLKGANADRDQVERTGLVLFFYPFVAIFLFGFFSFFMLWGSAMHNIVIHGSYLFLTVFGLVNLVEHIGNGEGINTLINRD